MSKNILFSFKKVEKYTILAGQGEPGGGGKCLLQKGKKISSDIFVEPLPPHMLMASLLF
jgi:hypothetical protein